MPDCFISYSTQDEPFARAVHRDLAAAGLDVFMAAISLQPGDRWNERIHAALRNSPWVIFLASRAACVSPWVQQEIGRAVDGSKRLVPVVWDQAPTDLPGWVSQHQALDVRLMQPEEIRQRVLVIAQRIKADKVRGLLIAGGLVAGFFYLASKSE